MDTSSHVSMGAATGLFVASVASANNVEINTSALVIYSIVANVLPDIDVVLKLKSNATYINNHRGVTHSIVFALIWIVMLSSIAQFRSPENYIYYIIVATLGISAHIFTDLLNGYGVQFLWPFHKKWIAFGITYTFDIVFLISHFVTLILMFTLSIDPIIIIPVLYFIIILYIFVEFILHYRLRKMLIQKYGKYKRLILQSKSRPLQWKYVYETDDKNFYMGIINKQEIIQLRYEKRLETIPLHIEKILLKDKAVNAFINFTPIYNYHIKHRANGTLEIKYYDLRYLMVRKGKQMYQLNCLVRIKDDKVLKSYVGFVINEETAHKKLRKQNTN